MLTDDGSPPTDLFGYPIDPNYDCEFCGRSTEARFGGTPPAECDSCAADFKRLMTAGKVEIG